MKKALFLFLFLLLVPFCVKASEPIFEYYSVGNSDSIGITSIDPAKRYLYATSYTYENGMYTLAGETVKDTLNWLTYFLPTQDYYYTCESETASSCEKITVVFRSIRCSYPAYDDNHLGLHLSNNENVEDKLTFYLGKDYKEEDGMYTLVDYEEHELSEISQTTYLTRTYEGYYMCPTTYGLFCDNMIVLFDIGSDYTSVGESLDHWHLIGDGYQYIDGQFKLINPRRSLLASTQEREGYTCISKEDTCDEVYYVEIGEFYWYRDGGRPYTYYKVELPNEREVDQVRLITGDEYKIDSFFTTEELNAVVITDPSIVDIDRGAIIAKEVEETCLIYEAEGIYKELLITVTEKQINPMENPKTGYKICLLVGIISFLLITLIIELKRKLS